MNFLITPIIDIPADELPGSPAELTAMLSSASKAFHGFTLEQNPHITMPKAKLHDREVEDYSIRIVGMYTEGGDLWFITPDGGHLNIDSYIRDIRKGVENAWL